MNEQEKTIFKHILFFLIFLIFLFAIMFFSLAKFREVSTDKLNQRINIALSNEKIYNLGKSCYLDNYKSCSDLDLNNYRNFLTNGINCVALKNKLEKESIYKYNSEILANFIVFKFDKDTCNLQKSEIQKLINN